MPWFAPTLSSALCRALHNLGHLSVLEKGEEIRQIPLSSRLVFVKSGFVAQALLNPISSTPFMMTLSGNNSLSYTAGVSRRIDHLSRRFWAATRCEVLTVIPEILLRVAEIDPVWNQELSNYTLDRAVNERLGLLICQVADVKTKLGVFVVSAVQAAGENLQKIFSGDADFCALPLMPSRQIIATVTSSPLDAQNLVCREWIENGDLFYENHKIFIRVSLLKSYWQWLRPFVQMQKQIQEEIRPVTPQDRLKNLGII